MTPRWATALSWAVAVLLLAIAALHGSGYGYVAQTLDASALPDFLKRVLPPLFLYPSALMAILAGVVLASLRLGEGRRAVLTVVATIVGANAVLGFVLGGLIPGGVLALVAGLLWTIASADRGAKPRP